MRALKQLILEELNKILNEVAGNQVAHLMTYIKERGYADGRDGNPPLSYKSISRMCDKAGMYFGASNVAKAYEAEYERGVDARADIDLAEANLGDRRRPERLENATQYMVQMVQNKYGSKIGPEKAKMAALTLVKMFRQGNLDPDDFYVAAQRLLPSMDERDLEEFVQWMMNWRDDYLQGEDIIDEAKLMWDFDKEEPSWGGYGKRNRDSAARKRGKGLDFGNASRRKYDNPEEEAVVYAIEDILEHMYKVTPHGAKYGVERDHIQDVAEMVWARKSKHVPGLKYHAMAIKDDSSLDLAERKHAISSVANDIYARILRNVGEELGSPDERWHTENLKLKQKLFIAINKYIG